VDPLANPLWHALEGPQDKVAERNGLAARYQPDVAPFAALPDVAEPRAWADLATLVGPGDVALLFRSDVAAPPGWEELFRGRGIQMLAPARDDAEIDSGAFALLTPADVPAMLELVARTQPGPFAPRTIELGSYLGARDGDALVAMAGERMRLAGHTEISAVCTDRAYRRRGYARDLVRILAHCIRARGERPFLHVAEENTDAIRLYEALSFEVSRSLTVIGLRAPGRRERASAP
jgi:ribosomal protein S18 acetylase RimI-like enzyme